MNYYKSVESLPRLSVKDIQGALRKKGLDLGKLDTSLAPGESLSLSISYNRGESVVVEADIIILKGEGLALHFSDKAGNPMGEPIRIVPRAANIPGTRYYFRDPYTPGKLCAKLYYLPGVGEFVPRSILSSFGIIYSEQRKSRKQRYYSDRKPLPSTKYRKFQYRGQPTPFGERYERLAKREDLLQTEEAVAIWEVTGIFSPELEARLIWDYCSRLGRKNDPRLWGMWKIAGNGLKSGKNRRF